MTATKSTPLGEDGEEIQAEVADLERYATQLRSAILDAGSCETQEDLAANLEEAMVAFKAIKADLGSLLKRAEKLVKAGKADEK